MLRRYWFQLSAGLICFSWAFIAWLTVIPNQDILADGIQAQGLTQDLRLVLAFPGQKHGGPLEYPFTVLAELLFPGNYFANAAIRPLLAFVTGVLTACLFLRLFISAPRWAFLTAMAVGPTIIHGSLGPESNPVGVWWLQPNWDMAWLLVVGGALVLARNPSGRPGAGILGGLFVGLGFFAHPAIVLLIVPLMVLVVSRVVPSPRLPAFGVVGAAIGVVPALVSYVVNARVNTWDPSHGAFISTDYLTTMGGAVLGLDGIPDYMRALLPYAFGLAPSDYLLDGTAKSVLMWAVVITIVVVSLGSSITAIRRRRRLTVAGSLAVAWLAAVLTMLVFIVFIDPVWIYSSGLAILYWLTVGALPLAVATPYLGAAAAAIVLCISGLSTVTHNWEFYKVFPTRLEEKSSYMRLNATVADELKRARAYAVFGSYYDAIPVGYASGQQIRTLTNRYNRFPLTPGELTADRYLVGVNRHPTDPWGEEALATVEQECILEAPTPSLAKLGYGLFSCSPESLVFER